MFYSIPNIFSGIKILAFFRKKKLGGWNKRVEKLCEKRFTFSSHELLSCLINLSRGFLSKS
ncbi:MAG: hypothetical protein C0611_00125 [Desulfobacteraceae bacterium]|nr:MAG: hypothetical protein C0611_00125 [Desulfobacteraceae bacterium]